MNSERHNGAVEDQDELLVVRREEWLDPGQRSKFSRPNVGEIEGVHPVGCFLRAIPDGYVDGWENPFEHDPR